MSLVSRKSHSHRVVHLILIYLATTGERASGGEQACSLGLATNTSRPGAADAAGALCEPKLDSIRKTFYLNNCAKIASRNGTTNHPKCTDLLAREQFCFLYIEIKHFASFTGLPPSTTTNTTEPSPNGPPERSNQCLGDMVKVTILLTSVDVGLRNGTKLFQSYPTNYEVSKLVMRQVKLYEPMRMDEFIEFQFGGPQELKRLRFVEFHDMKFANHFPEISEHFETIGVYHSLVPSVRKYSFKMGQVALRRVEMVDVEMLQEKGFEKDAFTLVAANCFYKGTETLEIALRNMELKHEVLKWNLIKDYWINSSCNGSLILNVTVTGNEFDRTIPEPVFKELFEYTLRRPATRLVFQFDPIDCCFRTNSWLFPLLFKHKNKTDDISLHCDDLGLPATSVKNETQLNESCYRRNVFPIYMIAIVSILLLALLFGIFSFVCVYHILPSKNQEIMLRNNNSDIKNSSSELPATKASSVIEAKSTQTEVTGKSVPLLSKSVSELARQRKGLASLKGFKSPRQIISSPVQGLSNELAKTTQRSSGQQMASRLKTTKSPTSLLKGKRQSSGEGKKVLNLRKVMYKLPGYKNRELKQHHKRAKQPKEEVLRPKRPSVEKSPGRNQSRERSPASPTPPMKPPPQPVVLPKVSSAGPPASSTVTQKTASKTQLQATKTMKTDSKSVGEGMSLAFKTINP